MKKPFFYIIAGPTGVGKTELAEKLARKIGGEIINADVGQFYAPFRIGTATPNWKESNIVQHLFDIKTDPENFSCAAYRLQAGRLIKDITARGNIPIVVGGSGFYYQSLLWDVGSSPVLTSPPSAYPVTWHELQLCDPDRAASIHPHDIYRIERALALWHKGGVKPSSCKPTYTPLGDFTLVHVTRSRQELYERINVRTPVMMDSGWVTEVTGLTGSWRDFVRRKKFIGYTTILDYLEGGLSYGDTVAKIQKATRNYAKRQLTFFSSLKRKLSAADPSARIQELDLTLSSVDLYLNSLT